MMNNKMPEKPMLMATSMVSATLAGNKTQTRRTTGLKKINENPDRYLFHKIENGVAIFWDSMLGERVEIKLPYGLPGGNIWVREKFCYGEIVCGDYVAPYPEPLYVENCEGKDKVVYYQNVMSSDIGIEDVKWKPSIHMFRKHSRINLFQKKIRVERLNEISEEDAIKEGVLPNCTAAVFKDGKWSIPENANCPRQDSVGCDGCSDEWASYPLSLEPQSPEGSAWESFRSLWESINGFQSWNKNPWLWVVEFKVINATS